MEVAVIVIVSSPWRRVHHSAGYRVRDLAGEDHPSPILIVLRQTACPTSPGPRGRIRLGVALSIPDADLLRKCNILKEFIENIRLYGDVKGPKKAKVDS